MKKKFNSWRKVKKKPNTINSFTPPQQENAPPPTTFPNFFFLSEHTKPHKRSDRNLDGWSPSRPEIPTIKQQDAKQKHSLLKLAHTHTYPSSERPLVMQILKCWHHFYLHSLEKLSKNEKKTEKTLLERTLLIALYA